MKHYYFFALLLASSIQSFAQDLEIQNLSSNWGYNFDPETGVISNVFFNPAEGDGTDIDDSFVVSWGVQSDANDPSTYTELDRQTITQGLPAFNSITVDNWESQNMNDFGLPAGDYLVVAWVDTDDDISETDESDNALFLATSADDAFSFEPGGGTNVNDVSAVAQIQLFPNPATTHVNVEMKGELHWQVHNSIGQVMRTGQTIGDQRLTIAIQNLPKGIYYFMAWNGDQRVTHSFTKE